MHTRGVSCFLVYAAGPTLVCPDEVTTLQCPRGSSITVTSALYGFFDSWSACNIPLRYENSTCNNANATRYVSDLCDDKDTCTFDADNVALDQVLGDPCVNVLKFMEVYYACTGIDTMQLLCVRMFMMHLEFNILYAQRLTPKQMPSADMCS